MMTWKPTDVFLRGKIIKGFLPIEKYPNLNDGNLRNLYPGDEVYIFEVTGNYKWARGYVITKLLPHDFNFTSVELDNIPTSNITVLVFPMKCVQIVEQIPLSSKFDYNPQIPRILYMESSITEARNVVLGTSNSTKMRPLLPIKTFKESDNLIEEMKDVIELLTSHIFAFYSIGDFHIFYELSQIYNSLDELRLKLVHDILTSSEAKMAKDIVIYLLNKIPKVLSSRDSQLSVQLKGLNRDNADISGYTAMFARDTSTGGLLSNSNSIPLSIAFNQILCSLSPKYLTNVHLEEPKPTLTSKIQNMFSQKLAYDVLVDFKSLQMSSRSQSPGYLGTILYFYIRYGEKRISETFAVRVNHPLSTNCLEVMNATLFKNITFNEMNSDHVYLISQVVDEIELSVNDLIKKPSLTKIRKEVAVGVTDISKLFSNRETSDQNLLRIRLFGSYMDLIFGNEPHQLNRIINNRWDEMFDRTIESLQTGIACNLKDEGLVVCLRCFKHQPKVVIGDDILAPIFSIRPLIPYPLIDEHECLYLMMGKVVLLESTEKNDLLTMKVCAPGKSLVFANANEGYKDDWQFLTVNPNESIEEIVRITGFSLESVKEDEFIVLSLYVNGELTAEGRFLYKSGSKVISTDNKNCSIELVSISNASTIACVNISTSYIGKLFNADMNVNKVLQFEEFFKDGDMGIRQLSAWLIAFHQLGLRQLVRHFNELLRALFLIADISTKQPKSESQQNLKFSTFSAIIYILDTVFNGNDSYLYLIPMFTQKNRSLPPIGTFIIENISNNLFQTEKTWTSTAKRVCGIFSILMNFAIKPMDNSSDFDEYFKALENMCESGSYFLSLKSDFFVDYQVLIIDALDDIISCDLHVNDVEALKLIVRLIDSIGIKGLGIDDVLYITNKVCISNKNARTEKAHRIILSKLLLIHRLFYTKLVKEPATREILFSKAVEWAMEVLQGQVDVSASRIACSVLNCVCTLVWRNLAEENNRNEVQLCYSLSKLLPSISRAIIKYERFTRENGFYKPKTKFGLLFPRDLPFTEAPVDDIVGEEVLVEILVELSTISCFIARIGKKVGGDAGYHAILKAEAAADFFDSSKYLVDDFRSKDLIDLIFGVNIIRRGKFIPTSKWLSLYSLLIEGCVVSLELIKPLLHSYFIPCFGSQKKFEIVLWGNFFKCLLQLAVVIPVSIEHLSNGSRKACYQITGEVRDKIAYMLNESWDLLATDSDDKVFARFNISRLGGYQMKFINTRYCILQDLMLFALQKNSNCQAVAVKLLWSIMVVYFLEKKSIMDVERQCLLGFRDIYYNNVYKPSVFEQGKFIDGLKQTIRLDRESDRFEVFAKFIKSTEEFLSTLNEYSNIPIGSEFDEDRTFHELNINVYLKGANKPELLNSLINTIYEKNVKNMDYIQAALSMELLASTYSWDQNILPASLKPKFHRQTSFERKETLFNIAAKNFIKGSNLERAADIYNELLEAYLLHTYDLKRFANIHTKLASLYLGLETSDKLSSSYFKVSYIGVGFPPNVNGKIQIYEGRPFEHVKSIQNRLLKLHPRTQIITDHWEALKLRFQIGKYLHVCAVEPMYKISGRLISATLGTRKYARNKDLRFFTLIRKLPGATSAYDLWTEEITYETNLRFPTILNKSEIRNIKVVKLSPLDNAVRAIANKNNELAQVEIMLINAFEKKINYSSLLKDLGALLAGIIDSPVNGGVGQYRNFINDDQYGDGQHLASQKLLKDAFDELCVRLNRCLQMHSKLITPDMKAFHDALSELYNINFEVEIAKLNLSNDHSSAYNHMHYPSPMSSQFEKELPLGSSESSVSNSISDVSVSAGSFSSPKLSMRMSKLLNWKKLRNQNSVR